MKKTYYSLVICILIVFSTKAQDIKDQENPLSEARFNYFKETILVFNEYLDTDNGSFNTTNLRVLHPIGNRSWNLRTDIPLISTNTAAVNKSGIGDVAVAISYIPYLSAKNGFAIRTKITSNSASDSNFGSGKWVLSTALVYGHYLSNDKKLLWMATVENQSSFAGSSTRSTINTSVFENTLLYSFGKNWVGTNMALRYNATSKGFPNSTFIEYGRKFTPNSMFYIHPSLGFGYQKAYNSGMELGLVILY
ncbi:lipid A phosphoethanolamine transferase [Flavobacterium restrictum]|uniref:Lipid A phosphoethanolamine transferase n=1 Tax=Flavobacterium restrictum TaxID=2594428 RepID=A0A553E987_9FLAO|nr:lipid A phosphoethanolamine transferase [Flavobacterium restrictum]TRX41393.1 lipid A phosphoethanolamine transferase [Flavobacterium restrictum]